MSTRMTFTIGWRALLLLTAGVLCAGQALAQTLGPVSKDYFGLIMNRSDPQQQWPAVPFGSWRLWDARVAWPNLEPQRGKWDFSTLDRLVAEAGAHDVKLLLVLAHSPDWASARPSERSAYKPGFAAEPAQIEDWRNYVRTVATRYKGRINEYQVWNEPSDKSHYTGSVAQLVEMTCEAQRILKGIDPAIQLVSAGSAGGGRHIEYLDNFLAGGGAKCIDVVAHHFYVPRFGPEAMVPMIREVRQVMAKRGVGNLPLWNTEAGWWIANTDGTPDHDIVAKGGWRKVAAGNELAGLIQRALLLSRSEGVDRFYWYSWTNTYGWGLAQLNGSPRPGVQAWAAIHSVMLGKILQPCVGAEAGYACDILDPHSRQTKTLRWRDAAALQRREGPAQQPATDEVVPWNP